MLEGRSPSGIKCDMVPNLNERFQALSCYAPRLDIAHLLEQIKTAMRVGWTEVVKPYWDDIRQNNSGNSLLQCETKDTAGYQEIFTKADIEMSERLLEASYTVGLSACYSEEHGPYSKKYTPDQKNFSYRTYEDFAAAQVVAVADPIDGSKEFIHGLTGFAMHWSLLVKHPETRTHLPALGVLYVPARDELWYNTGPEELIFEHDGQKSIMLKIPQVDILDAHERALKCHYSPFDLSDAQKELYTNLAKQLGFDGYELIDGGAAGSSFSLLLQNKLDVVVAPVDFSKQWDNAMVDPLLLLRGGQQIDAKGSNFRNFHRQDPFNSEGYIAYLGMDSSDVVQCLPVGLIKRHRQC